ncbi:MAG: hypothetical protein M3Z37_09690 [Candidatus Eremiobacteraeota bacterium]|nr:hypothetical protein [Candidatus Eremiobacteraeota bacterium]
MDASHDSADPVKPPRYRGPLLVLTFLFIIVGVIVAFQQGFEIRVGHQLQKAAPVARRVLPPPAKRVLREGRELLPIYGPAGQWLARKGASVVYFGIVGVFVVAIRRRKITTLRQTLITSVLAATAMSAVVEIIEWPEAFGSEMFDLLCGAVGGLGCGLLTWWWWRRRWTRQPSARR